MQDPPTVSELLDATAAFLREVAIPQLSGQMLRQLIRKTAWEMDQMPHPQGEHRLSDKVSMCNYWANRMCCEAADRAMQVHGGIGYSRHKPFEHIYRHRRRYRLTEGSEEIQIRKVAAYLFGYAGPRKAE
jgi:acyl-CoA dehydrogenase